MIKVLFGHFFLHNCALEILVPTLLVLDLVLHELVHSSDLYFSILGLKLPLKGHLGHLISLLHLVLVLELFGSLVLGLDFHCVIVEAPVLMLHWIEACSAVSLNFLLVLPQKTVNCQKNNQFFK